MTNAWDLRPFGNWDAWSIWNLRAKFLLGSHYAWSPLLANTHPEYPLLLSGAVARCWALSGASPEIAPIAIGYLFFLSLIAVVTGGVAIARGSLMGLIAGLTLACSTTLLDEASSQCADIPIAAFFACAVVFVLIDRPIWAGVFAGFAAWTKDEGAMFCVVLLVLIAVFRGSQFQRFMPGVLPGAMVYCGFKAFLAPHVTGQFGAGTFSRLAEGGRWGVVVGGVFSQIVSLGASWVHPALILVVFAIGVGLWRDSRRDAFLLTALAGGMLAAYTLALVASPNEVVWQTNTAASRLILQWWPVAIIAIVAWLRPAEEAIAEVEVTKRKRR
jgi:hypothetical protein